MKRKKLAASIPMLLLLIAIGLAALLLYKLNENKYTLYISHDSGIYSEAIELVVKPLAEGKVYYTTDGSTPQAGHTSTQVYENPIIIELGENTIACSYQFYCVYKDGEESPVFRRDFILDKQGTSRFTTQYVVSVTGDEEKLFGYEEGIFVRGRQFDEYMEANQEVNILSEVIPANYLSNEELGVHAAIFLADGTQVTDQNCGLKIYGNVTRAKNQKSFRLTARMDYDAVNEFTYPFLPKLVSDEGQTSIDAFQRLSFHNAGNDNGYAFMRTELVGELARRAGFPDVLAAESAVVYINGRYQGVYWINNTFDDRYFNEKYGDYVGEFSVCEGALSEMWTESVETEAERQCAEEYNAFCKWVETADLTTEASWQRVQSTIDVENFAKYMAIEYYVGNIDWPHNNVKTYRYLCAPGEEYTEGTVFDGRYRYLLYDTDYGMGLQFMGWFGNDAQDRILQDLCNTNEYTGLFKGLLQREEFRNLFIGEVLSLMNTSFARSNVEAALNELNGSRYEELRYMMEETDLLKDSLWESDDNAIANVENEMAVILNFADYRPATVASEMQEQWDCGGFVLVEVANPGTANTDTSDPTANSAMTNEQTLNTQTSNTQVCINDAAISANTEFGAFVGTYFENIPLTISCNTTPGVIVDGYQIGSTYHEGNAITLTPADYVSAGETLQIQAVICIESVESLAINRFHIRGAQDYIVLRNNGQTPVLLSDYSLVDTFDDLSKGQLPYQYLQPGEEFIVYGKEYAGEQADNSCQVTYGWATDEPVLLVHSTRGIVDAKNTRSQNTEKVMGM